MKAARLWPRPAHRAQSHGGEMDLLPAARLIPVPKASLKVARWLFVALITFGLLVAIVPWQQNITGSGKVIAFSPDHRPQAVQATISGRIVHWHIQEGSAVEAGDILVELADNDPERLMRLQAQDDAARARLEAYQAQALAYDQRLQALKRSQGAEIRAAQAEVDGAYESLRAKEELLAAASAKMQTAQIQQKRIGQLATEGLASSREEELAQLEGAQAQASLKSKRADIRYARASLERKRAQLDQIQADTEADMRSATAALRSAETQVAAAQAHLADTASKLAQQAAQILRAPRAGIIQRIYAQQGGLQVSRGQTLAQIVPTTNARAVELYVDGNDAALISQGHGVRLQFEGWPAVQMAGWPSVAVGTFGGQVAFVDPSDNGMGDFRVVIIPDEKSAPWPETQYLRQGTRANGWVLLDTVRLGFEFWRQLNGFPPALKAPPKAAAQSSGTLQKGGA